MRVCIGSLNKSKINGVYNAFRKFFNELEIKAYEVSSGVSAQPLDLKDVVRGAYNRAENVLEKDLECSYGVGVEAGIFNIDSYYFDVQATCIMDKEKFYSYGFSPAYPVPERFARLLLNGIDNELEDIVNQRFNRENIGDEEGFIGILTDKVVTREELTLYSTIMALIPHIKKGLYRD